MGAEQISEAFALAAGESLQDQQYWTAKLSGELTKSVFSYDYIIKKEPPEFSSVPFTFPGELFSRLMKLSNESDYVLHMILVTGIVVLLHKYTDYEDIIIGTPIDEQETEQEIEGEFINTVLALRNQTREHITFKEMLFQVRETINEAVEHQNYPIESLVYDLNMVMSAEEFPLFDVVVLMENIHDEKYLRHIPCNVIFSFNRTHRELAGKINYNSFRYDRVTLERIGTHFVNLMEHALANVEVKLSALDILTIEEQKQLLFDFNGLESGTGNRNTDNDPSDKMVQQLVEEQVEKKPDNIAVVFRGENLTYGMLNQRANQLARLLRERGVAADTLVGIMLERSIEMILGLVGILKAGGAYLPLEVENPAPRILFTLKDSGAKLLLSKQPLENLIEFPGEFIRLEQEYHGNAKGTNLKKINHTGNLAYVIYTSGSTGNPKGVLVEHRSIANTLLWRKRCYAFGSRDVVLQIPSFAFDSSVEDIFTPVISGSKLVLLEQAKRLEPGYLGGLITGNHVTHFLITPALYSALLEEIPENLGTLRTVTVAGDSFKNQLPEKHFKNLPGVKLYNEYGPTETSVCAAVYEFSPGQADVLIGKPITNINCYILNSQGKLNPLGVAGQLGLAGTGVTRGYLNRVGLTAEKFIPNPFVPGERIYCTGDRAKWRKDGNLEFLGRIDQQVKIRGFRVEIGEIEIRLQEHPGIKEAVVIAKEDSRGNKALYAYLVGKTNLELGEITDYLSARLPGYMVPVHFVPLEQLPLTPNGKVDRRQLQYLDEGLRISPEYVPPGSELEKKLVEIWTLVLATEKPGVKDNFFNSGGDSIKALKLLSVINERLNLQLKVADLYLNATIRDLAQKIYTSPQPAADQAIKAAMQELQQLQQRVMSRVKKEDREELEEIYPMSDIEIGMVFHTLKDTESGVYHEQMVYQVNYHQFSAETLKKALNLMVEKHTILRTSFNTEDFEEPVQMVYRTVHPDILCIDLAGADIRQQENRIKAVMEESRRHPFNISTAPLWRTKVFDLGQGKILFFWECHHAILDGWSSASLMTELHNTYLKLNTTPSYVPAKLKGTYKDMVLHQRVQKKDPAAAAFWRNQLEGYRRFEFPHREEKRGDNAGTADRTGRRLYNRSWESAFLEKLLNLSLQYNTEMKNLCLAAMVYMLNMFSYHNDIVVGLITNTRPVCEDSDRILGCFLNTVPVRIKIPATLTWGDYIHRVHEQIAALKKYEMVSLFEIVKMIGEKSQEQNPISDIIFNFVDFHVYRELESEGIRTAIANTGNTARISDSSAANLPQVPVHNLTNTLFDFTVSITNQVLLISINYSAAFIAPEDVERGVGYFKAILNKFLEEPGQPLDKASLIPLREKQQLLQQLNGANLEYPREITIHGWFARQVEMTAHRVALVLADQQLTYGELEQNAQSLALELRKRGVTVGQVVGLMVERSVAMIIGILGILKAGGAYLPLDPDYPPERHRGILADSGAKILLTNHEITGLFSPQASKIGPQDVPSFGVWDLGTGISPGGTPNHPHLTPPAEATFTSPVYIIYTSGSTGKPKGVMLEHRNLVNLMKFQFKYTNINCDKVLQFAAFGFDASFHEMATALLSGGTLVLVGKETRENISQLFEVVIKNKITTLFLPISFLKLVFSAEEYAGRFPSCVRHIQTAGDRVVVGDRFRQYLNRHQVYLHNHYGPSETHVITTLTLAPSGEIPLYPSIGRPIANTRIFILDRNGHLQAPGVPGELAVTGDQVGRGYLNQVELTAEKFDLRPPGGRFLKKLPPRPPRKNFLLKESKSQEDRFKRTSLHPALYPGAYAPDSRLYYTGDLGRWLPDGCIQFLGRIDHQVKIRGFRVEPGEIETQLRAVDFIKDAVVICAEPEGPGSGEKFLCAYIAAEKEWKITALRELLLKKLPDYMIPTYFVRVKEIPLNASGKVNRKALPAPSFHGSAANYTGPANRIQEQLLGIFAEVLAVEKNIVGIDANFFELGGHSLRTLLLTAKIHKTFDVRLRLKDVFKMPTVRKLADFIRQEKIDVYIPMGKVEKREYYGLAYNQKRLWYIVRLQPQNTAFNLNQQVVLREAVDPRVIKKTIAAIVQRHESLRTAFKEINGQPYQVVEPEVEILLETVDLSGMNREARQVKRSQLANEFIGRPFQLENPPLFRSLLLKGDKKEYELLFSIHHITADGQSLEILTQEFNRLYEAYQRGQTPGLPPWPIQYKDFCQWQNRCLVEPEFKEQAHRFWRKQLAQDFLPLQLPGSTRGDSRDNRSLGFRSVVDQDLKEKLLHLAWDNRTTLFTVLFAALNVMLSHLSGQQEIACGIAVSGRETLNLQQVVGFFVNTLLIKNHLDPDEDFNQFLNRVKENLLEALQYQNFPLEKVLEELKMRFPPLPLCFNMLNFPGELPQLKNTESFHINSPQDANFDMTAYVREYKNGIEINWIYKAVRFSPALVEYIARGYLEVLNKSVMG
jgi:tyrocidine synthetase-3